MPRESGASSSHGEACGYWIARPRLLPRKRERAMTTKRARGDRSSPVMPRESGASSNHGEACGYWIARRSLLPRKRERAMTTSTACDRAVEVHRERAQLPELTNC